LAQRCSSQAVIRGFTPSCTRVPGGLQVEWLMNAVLVAEPRPEGPSSRHEGLSWSATERRGKVLHPHAVLAQ
jgi:hypothetical protein